MVKRLIKQSPLLDSKQKDQLYDSIGRITDNQSDGGTFTIATTGWGDSSKDQINKSRDRSGNAFTFVSEPEKVISVWGDHISFQHEGNTYALGDMSTYKSGPYTTFYHVGFVNIDLDNATNTLIPHFSESYNKIIEKQSSQKNHERHQQEMVNQKELLDVDLEATSKPLEFGLKSDIPAIKDSAQSILVNGLKHGKVTRHFGELLQSAEIDSTTTPETLAAYLEHISTIADQDKDITVAGLFVALPFYKDKGLTDALGLDPSKYDSKLALLYGAYKSKLD